MIFFHLSQKTLKHFFLKFQNKKEDSIRGILNTAVIVSKFYITCLTTLGNVDIREKAMGVK